MSITLTIPEKPILHAKIMVFGVGGAGCNAVNNMINSQLTDVDFVVSNTDAQSLEQNLAKRHIQMGADKTEGLGAGSRPDIGYEAAEESSDEISSAIEGAHMVFVTAGMGGGTGTGAAPVVARLAQQNGALTVGVVTKPFKFEGTHRMQVAEKGIEEMEKYVDTLLIIPNQNLFRVSNEQTTFADSFGMADRVLYSAVSGVTNLITRPGLINLDFADVRTIMGGMGKAVMGTGEASGEKRGVEAAEKAIANPLLDDISMKGARGVLISVMGDQDVKLYEVEEAVNRIRSEVDPDANIIFGATNESNMDGAIRVSIVATGIDLHDMSQKEGAAGSMRQRARFDPRPEGRFARGQRQEQESDEDLIIEEIDDTKPLHEEAPRASSGTGVMDAPPGLMRDIAHRNNEENPSLWGRLKRVLGVPSFDDDYEEDYERPRSPVSEPLAETPLAETPLAETPRAEAPLAETPRAEITILDNHRGADDFGETSPQESDESEKEQLPIPSFIKRQKR